MAPFSDEPSQLLSSLLSLQSSYSLPYSDDAKLLIHQQLLSLTQCLPSLSVRFDTFVHNNGNSVNALQAVGTFPMPYKGVTYNIPITIWLLEEYPVAAPRVFLTPTRDMVIKRHHKHVDASGLVSVPYLESWVFPTSNLLGLVRSLGFIFGQDPPLFSYASARSGFPPRLRKSQSSGSVAAQFPSSLASQSPSTSKTSVPPVPPSPSQSKRTENPSDVFKRIVIDNLENRLQKDLSQVRKTQEAEMDYLMNMQSQLKQREHQLERGIQEIKSEREGLERQLQLIRANTEALEGWLKVNVKRDLEFDIDDVYEPCDILSKHLLENTSADLAIEDTLYSLDKAVQDGLIPLDKYFKNVRSLAREQFFHRAISAKIQAAQQRMQVASSGTEMCFR